MNAEEAVEVVRQGRIVHCTASEYHAEVRSALQKQAGKWIDEGQDPYAWVALNEVKRPSPGD